MKFLVAAAVAFTSFASLLPAKATTLEEVVVFAEKICTDIPEGSLTRTTIKGKIGANASVVAKLVSGEADLTVERTSEIVKGILFKKLPKSIPTFAMCKFSVVEMLKSQIKLNMTEVLPPTPPVIQTQYDICVGEYERACLPHQVYLYCGADIGAWAAARCTASSATRLDSKGGNKCGYSLVRVFCTGPK
jgi:hypothetical protein